MSTYLVIHWPERGGAEAFTEVWNETYFVKQLAQGGDLTLSEALRFLDGVDKQRYDKIHPEVWVWRLHGGE